MTFAPDINEFRENSELRLEIISDLNWKISHDPCLSPLFKGEKDIQKAFIETIIDNVIYRFNNKFKPDIFI